MNSKHSDCPREHDFTLVVDGPATLTTDLEDALFSAGCDDATISSRGGRLYFSFSRSAPTIGEAIVSAVHAIQGCGKGLRVLRIDVCDLVTQSDIARKIGRSRQQVHQYIVGRRGPGSFPAPACTITEGAPLWYWCEVAQWLWNIDLISEDVLDEAVEVAVINSVLELEHQRKMSPAKTQEIMRSLSLCE